MRSPRPRSRRKARDKGSGPEEGAEQNHPSQHTQRETGVDCVGEEPFLLRLAGREEGDGALHIVGDPKFGQVGAKNVDGKHEGEEAEPFSAVTVFNNYKRKQRDEKTERPVENGRRIIPPVSA